MDGRRQAQEGLWPCWGSSGPQDEDDAICGKIVQCSQRCCLALMLSGAFSEQLQWGWLYMLSLKTGKNLLSCLSARATVLLIFLALLYDCFYLPKSALVSRKIGVKLQHDSGQLQYFGREGKIRLTCGKGQEASLPSPINPCLYSVWTYTRASRI